MQIQRLMNDGYRWIMEPHDPIRWSAFFPEPVVVTRCGHGALWCNQSHVVPGSVIPKGTQMFVVQEREQTAPGLIDGPVHLLSPYVIDFVQLLSEGGRNRLVEDAAVPLVGGTFISGGELEYTLLCPPASRVRLVIASDAAGIQWEVREPEENAPAGHTWTVLSRQLAAGTTALAGEIHDMVAPPGGGLIEVYVRNPTGAARDIYLDCGWIQS